MYFYITYLIFHIRYIVAYATVLVQHSAFLRTKGTMISGAVSETRTRDP